MSAKLVFCFIVTNNSGCHGIFFFALNQEPDIVKIKNIVHTPENFLFLYSELLLNY